MTKFSITRDGLETVKPTRGLLTAGQDLNPTALTLWTLENPWLNNAPNVSCIPPGSYRCVIAWSNRYARLMPRLLNVPNREGILIHSGNTTADTKGCILVGTEKMLTGVAYSRLAFSRFFSWLGIASRAGDVVAEVSYAA